MYKMGKGDETVDEDFDKLKQKVFDNEKKLKKLQSDVHNYIQAANGKHSYVTNGIISLHQD